VSGSGRGDGEAATVTDLLRGEHGALYALFDAIGQLLDAGDDPARARLACELLRPVLASHAGLEDGLLLQGLEGAEPGPLAAMQEEHRGIERLLEEIGREEGDVRVRELLEELLATARDHFEREEWAAFPYAESRIEEASLRRLGADWAARRGVHFD